MPPEHTGAARIATATRSQKSSSSLRDSESQPIDLGVLEMARYTKTVDIWTLSDDQRRDLAIGQWVTAGPDGGKGRFYGQGHSTVVAWLGNCKGRYRSYMATIAQYGRQVRHNPPQLHTVR